MINKKIECKINFDTCINTEPTFHNSEICDDCEDGDNYDPKSDYKTIIENLNNKKIISVGSDFSGVGAFDVALKRIEKDENVKIETVFSADFDKYARETYIANHGEPKYFPWDVYEREIPAEPLDVYMTSPPCQTFSRLGKNEGKDDPRGILFFNSLEFIRKNNPRFFIFENVKGLLTDNDGKTFSEWVNYLGGKSINGLPLIFPFDGSVQYHLYFKILNSRDFNIPQNRERIFLVGIRDDEDNNFQFPKEEYLTRKLNDLLEENPDKKYWLSKKFIKMLREHKIEQKEIGNGFGFVNGLGRDYWNSITTKCGQRGTDMFLDYGGDKIRRLTMRECFRFQDFPDNFKLIGSEAQQVKQAGNSISVGVLERVLRKLPLWK